MDDIVRGRWPENLWRRFDRDLWTILVGGSSGRGLKVGLLR